MGFLNIFFFRVVINVEVSRACFNGIGMKSLNSKTDSIMIEHLTLEPLIEIHAKEGHISAQESL